MLEPRFDIETVFFAVIRVQNVSIKAESLRKQRNYT